MKIALLTSSRADYSIYVPLIKAILAESWQLEIIAFGTHLSPAHGLTYQLIEKDGFVVAHKLMTLVAGDKPCHVAASMALTMSVFAEFWAEHTFDLVIALGDRYEMFAAVAAAMPFNYIVAHISGGETTLGAIDNAFRHSISHMSRLHFVSAQPYAERLQHILGTATGIYNTGSLSLENYQNFTLLSRRDLFERWGVDEGVPYILITLHPETVSYKKNSVYVDETIAALNQLEGFLLVITMPNADTMGDMIREKWISFSENNKNVRLVENFGSVGYLSAMYHCQLMLGNTSSGFVEASMFPKWVINLGNRQQGRISTPNILQVPFDKVEIRRAIDSIRSKTLIPEIGIYGAGDASSRMISAIKENCGIA